MTGSPFVCPSSAPTYYIVTLHVIAACTVPINCLCLYLVWFHSPKISKYRYCLAYLQVVTFIVEIYMSWVSPGYYFFPMLGGYNTSELSRKFIPSHISVIFYFFVMCFELPSLLLCFIYRHASAMELGSGNGSRIRLKVFMVISSHTFPFITAICLINSELTYQQKYDLIRVNWPNCMHAMNMEGFMMYDWKINYWTAGVGVTAVVFIFIYGWYGFALAVHTIVILQKLKKHMSKQTYTMQRTAIISLSMQCVVPLVCIIVPVDLIVFVVVKELHEYQELATDTMFLITTHSAFSSIMMLATNKTFKQLIWGAIYKIVPIPALAKLAATGESTNNSVAPTSMNQNSLVT